MFEKETEEHCNEAVCGICEIHCNAKCHDWQDEYDAFQKGAELGYNKAKREAKEIILKLYNAGRDVLMCRAEEKVYNNLEEAINNKSIEQFLKEEICQ